MTTPGYSSANDLPSVVELRQQLRGARMLTRVVARSKRPELEQLQANLDRLIATIDDFYARLGPRHWVFHDDLNVEAVREMLEDEQDDDHLQARFIESQYEVERLSFMIGRLRSVAGMRPRMELIDKAFEDYRAGRYYATILVLITVMDGFVGDTDPGVRKGLHAREADELTAWDSVVGHHQGLRATQATFTKSFKRTSSDPIYELHRNGIVHGNLLSFDNVIVAAKAWNRLFAVSDWAKAKLKEAEPVAPQPKVRDVLRQIAQTNKLKQQTEAWTASALVPDDTDFETNDLVAAATGFMTAWHKGQWGRMGSVMPLRDQDREGKNLAKYIRDTFEIPRLETAEIVEVRFVAPAVGECRIDAQFANLGKFSSVSRWIFESVDGKPAVPPDEAATWRLVFGGSWPFMRDGEFQTPS